MIRKIGWDKMLQLMKSHTTVRKYTDEQISDETFHQLIEAAQHAASSNFVQAYSVIQVKDEQIKKQLGVLSRNEFQFSTAALSLVFCADLHRAKQAVERNDAEMIGDNLENYTVATIDTALFGQNFAIAAESMGYGVCYIGGVRNNPKEISELLDLPDYVIPLFAMTVGVPVKLNEVKPRLPVEAIIHEDGYNKEKYAEQLKEYDDITQAYYMRRTNNKKDFTWSETMKDFLSVEKRPHLLEFVQSKGFLTKTEDK